MKILILGIGNILFGDEGIGVHLSNLLKLNYSFEGEHEVDIVDGGTMAQHLIPIITNYDRVLILDCIDADNAQIGDIYYIEEGAKYLEDGKLNMAIFDTENELFI